MELNYSIIALIVGIAMALIRLIEYGLGLAYKIFLKQTDKGGTDAKQEIQLAVIETKLESIIINDLKHNKEDHDEFKIILGQIKTDVAVIKNEILK